MKHITILFGLLAAVLLLVRCGSGSSESACTSDGDCVDGVCVAEKCVDCRENSDCQRSGKCESNACVLRNSCEGGATCDEGICIDDMCMDCLSANDCDAAGYICQNNVCVEGSEECQGAATCNNHGTCSDSSGSIVCTCDIGYTGDRCEDCLPGYHDDGSGNCVHNETCQDDTCNNHGTCDDSSGTAVCTCDAAYTGTFCAECASGYAEWPAGSGTCLDDPCEPYPCDLPNTVPNGCVQTGESETICTCAAGYTWSGTECTDTCEDGDNDNHGTGPGCMGPDCDDTDPDIYDGNTETCDGKDNDCDGRTDCEGGACAGNDPCLDNDPCTEDTCDSEGAGCGHGPLASPEQVDCDPDGDDDEFAMGDGTCTDEMTCLRNKCQPCNSPEQCLDGECLCADETCSTRRCYDETQSCVYVTGDDADCTLTQTPAERQGEQCTTDTMGSDNYACDDNGNCVMYSCADCDETGCTYSEEEDADCGNSVDCAVCAGFNQCNWAGLGTSCSGGVAGCENRCNGVGVCESAAGRDCGVGLCAGSCTAGNQCDSDSDPCEGTGSCQGTCNNGTCNYPTGSCGSGNCTGTCSSGTCSSDGTDCGICCECSAAGAATYDANQDSDCAGYSSTNPCSNRCTALGQCGYPTGSTACGYGGWCGGNCDGAGSCDTQGDSCCSQMGGQRSCNNGDECYGTCNIAGVCSSYGDSCGSTCGSACTAHGTEMCAASGGCRCDTVDCSTCADIGQGYEYFDNFCDAIPQRPHCCTINDHGTLRVGCCTQTNCNGTCTWF
jgi:hypothetical protein